MTAGSKIKEKNMSNVFDMEPINAAQYWEAQADMWHSNYSELHAEFERLRTENEKLQAEVDKWNTAYLKSIKIGIDQACDSGSRIGQLNGWNEELRTENEKLREAKHSAGERITGYINMIEQREAEIEKLRAAAAALKGASDDKRGD